MLWFDKDLCYIQTCDQILILLQIMLKDASIFESCVIHKHSLKAAEFLKETRVIFCTLIFLRPLLNNYSILTYLLHGAESFYSIEILNRLHSQHKHGKYPDEIQ
jgi:hypothetical protein